MTAVHIADTAGTEHGGPVVRSRRHRVLRWTVALGAIALEVGLIAPLLTEHAPAFAAIQWGWVAAAVGAETASVVTIGALYRPLLRAGGVSVTRRRSLATGATASAITAMVPAGPVASSAYLYRQFRRAGSTGALAGWAVTATTGLGPDRIWRGDRHGSCARQRLLSGRRDSHWRARAARDGRANRTVCRTHRAPTADPAGVQ